MKPSDICNKRPYDSIFQNPEHEIVARNIMVILKRTGDKFKSMTWQEYKKGRLADGNFSDEEKIYFDLVIVHCSSEKAARNFSKEWNI
jgi:hypothetical protein